MTGDQGAIQDLSAVRSGNHKSAIGDCESVPRIPIRHFEMKAQNHVLIALLLIIIEMASASTTRFPQLQNLKAFNRVRRSPRGRGHGHGHGGYRHRKRQHGPGFVQHFSDGLEQAFNQVSGI